MKMHPMKPHYITMIKRIATGVPLQEGLFPEDLANDRQAYPGLAPFKFEPVRSKAFPAIAPVLQFH
jgi:hypothetical protein